MTRRVIVVGGGRVGRHAATDLATGSRSVVVVERDPEAVDRLADEQVGRVVDGDGTDPEVLERAGVDDADAVAALTDDTAANVTICELVADLAPGTRTLARIASDSEYDTAHLSHVDSVVYPESAGAAVAVERIVDD
jgi:trk system potassium uptake protein TrkA